MKFYIELNSKSNLISNTEIVVDAEDKALALSFALLSEIGSLDLDLDLDLDWTKWSESHQSVLMLQNSDITAAIKTMHFNDLQLLIDTNTVPEICADRKTVESKFGSLPSDNISIELFDSILNKTAKVDIKPFSSKGVLALYVDYHCLFVADNYLDCSNFFTKKFLM